MPAVTGNSRIQKPRRKSTAVNAASLERAIRAGQDAETDSSSHTQTPTEQSDSNEASPPSSASSTPRLFPAQKGSCCQPKPAEQPVQQTTQQGGCCSSKAKTIQEPVKVKSCCSGKTVQANATQNSQFQPHVAQVYGQQIQFQLQPQVHNPQYSNMQPHASVPASFPFGLGAPIYNHAAAAYHQPSSVHMGPMSPHMAGPPAGQHTPEHNCHCGESCSCFGCAAHPNNATMMEYVRLMAQFQYTGGFGTMSPPLYDMPTYPHHPGFGAEAHQGMGFNPMNQGFSTPTPTQMSFVPNMHMGSMSGTPMVASSAWQQPPAVASAMPRSQFFEPSSYVAPTPTSEAPIASKTEESAASPITETSSDGKDEETPTLSPSSYFWNEMTLPGCNDATGTCQCGDGCECVGCLTHGGHNGVQLEVPEISDASAFSDFSVGAGALHLDDDSNNFLFASTPS